MGEFSLFEFYRTALFVFLTIYYVLALLSGLARVIRLLSGDDPSKQMFRLYVSYSLLTIRLAPLRGELVQIGGWLAGLIVLWWLHTLI